MKKVWKIAAVVVVVLAVVLVVLSSRLGSIIKTAVNTAGTKAMKVPVSVDSVAVHLLTGDVRIRDLVIGNPEGFKTAHAFKIGRLDAAVEMGTITSDRIVIDRILIDGPEITYELGVRKNNLGVLKRQLEKPKNQTPEEPAEEKKPVEEEKKPGKKVEIRELVISNGRINISATALGGSEIPVPLPTITLRDIGKGRDGATPLEVVEEVLAAVLQAATGLVRGSVDLLGKGFELTGDAALGGARVGVEGAKAAEEAAQKAAGEAVDAAGEAVKRVGDALGQGPEATEEAVKKLGEESKKILGGLKGVLKGGKESEAAK